MRKKYGLANEEWENVKDEVRRVLIETAKTGGLITYSRLIGKLKSTNKLHHRSPALGYMLGEISCDENAEGRGMLTAIVIRKYGGRPGPGFFHLASMLGRDVSDKDICWSKEVEFVRSHWGNN
jgi:hypothetical protein